MGEWGGRAVCLQFVWALINTWGFFPEGPRSIAHPTHSPRSPRRLLSHFLCSSHKSGLCHRVSLQPESSPVHRWVLSRLPAAQPLRGVDRFVWTAPDWALSLHHRPNRDPFLTILHKTLRCFRTNFPDPTRDEVLWGSPPAKELAWSHWCCHFQPQGWCSSGCTDGITSTRDPHSSSSHSHTIPSTLTEWH